MEEDIVTPASTTRRRIACAAARITWTFALPCLAFSLPVHSPMKKDPMK